MKNKPEKKNVSKPDFFKKAKTFGKKYPGFIIAVIALVFLILVFFAVNGAKISSEEAEYVKQSHEETQAYFDYVLSVLEEDKNFVSALDDDYYSSIKEDYEWMKQKENELYAQGFGGIWERELAMSVFASEIDALNQSFIYEFYDSTYEEEINSVLNKEINYPDLFTQQDYDESFQTKEEAQLFSKTLDSLFKEYIAMKKNIVNGNSSIERRYVEAKKLLMLNEAAQDYEKE